MLLIINCVLIYNSLVFDKRELDEILIIKEVFKWVYGLFFEEIL